MITNNLDPNVHKAVDVAAAGGILGTMFGYLPAIAAILGIVYYVILIVESKTIQGWLDRRRNAKKKKIRQKNRGSSGARKAPHARSEPAPEPAKQP